MKTIGISAPLKSLGLQRMFDALGEVLEIRFEERTFGDDVGLDAWILHEADFEVQHRLTHSNCPCYIVISNDQLVPCGESSSIEFSLHHTLVPVLRGRQIRAEEAVNVRALPQWLRNVTVLATKTGAPVWAMQEVNGQQQHYVALSVPELNEGESLFQYFNGSQFLRLLPFLLFLRALTEEQQWEQSLLQACFMFDDPNLHWRTYGFIDFAQLAVHAQMRNYHVCFATIPQDTWFVHKPTALLFQQYHDRLSLLIHGNDHIAQELARPSSDEERDRNLRQALRRIDELERRSGVEVARVMVPPHGACSESTLREMARLGFEAACISRGSLRHYNGQASWLRTLGMRPSDIIGDLPVIPRIPFSGNCRNSILIAALLHQPIIVRGHHYDVAEGLQLLADLSGFINSLGTVHWADMKRISRSHYARKYDGKTLRVKMFTRRIEVCVPERIEEILVERSWLRMSESLPFAWKLLRKGQEWKSQRTNEPIPVLPGQRIEIVSEPSILCPIDLKNVRKLRLWPILRRQLTEARDRIVPLLRRVPTL